MTFCEEDIILDIIGSWVLVLVFDIVFPIEFLSLTDFLNIAACKLTHALKHYKIINIFSKLIMKTINLMFHFYSILGVFVILFLIFSQWHLLSRMRNIVCSIHSLTVFSGLTQF